MSRGGRQLQRCSLRSRWLHAIALTSALLLVPRLAWGQTGAPESLEGQLERLAARSGAQSIAGGALSQARLALQRAEELARKGMSKATARARAIAEAAIVLAGRQLAFREEQLRYRAAAKRARRAKQAALEAQAALQAALQERSRLESTEVTGPKPAPAASEEPSP